MIRKLLLSKYKNTLYFFFLILFSFSINQYYAFIGVLPVDSFSTFNSGYDLLNGSLPFKDYWIIKGPILDIIQAIFFKIFGVSWFSYAAHSSTFNSVFAVATFFTLRNFNLDIKYAFIYSALASALMYPTYGTPFTDHHVSIFSMLSVYALCLAIKTKKNIYWFSIPILLFLGFFSKQTPIGYFGILISIISVLYFTLNFDKKFLIYIFAGSSLIISLFFILIILYEIPFNDIVVQHFLFPISLGESRIDWLLPFEFQRFVLRYKLLYIGLSVPIFLLLKNLFKNFLSILHSENLIFLLLICTLLIFVTHQLMTINGLFIYFLIPVFSAFSHIYSQNLKNKKIFINFFLTLSIISTIYYNQKYIDKRDTLLLKSTNLNKSVDASVLSDKLKNLRWLTHNYPENPTEEIKNLLDSIEIIKKDSRKKMIVTDYQFISPELSINDNSAARVWWRHHIYPDVNEKYFDYWKNFLIKKIIKENIEVIYTIHPLEGEKDIFKGLVDVKCYSKKKMNKILVLQTLKSCEEFKNMINSKSKN